MEPTGIEATVERIAEAHEFDVYDVTESGDTLVIEQGAFDETRFTMTSALLFDRYDAEFDHIEVRLPTGETKRIGRDEFRESIHRFSDVIGN